MADILDYALDTSAVCLLEEQALGGVFVAPPRILTDVVKLRFAGQSCLPACCPPGCHAGHVEKRGGF